MGMSLSRVRHPGPVLAIYFVGVVLVCSFILFEVLDVDGSDFPGRAPSSAPVVRLADPPHDLKRAHLQAVADRWPDGPDLAAAAGDDLAAPELTRPPEASLRSTSTRAFRPALARASLADPLPSA